MEKIKVDLENCFGIEKLDVEFNFSKKNTFTIYAPNGTMKTSFAKTFEEYADPKGKIEDRIHNRESRYKIEKILDGNNLPLERDEIFVINSEINEYDDKDPQVTTLLVNKALQKEYKAIHKSIKDREKVVVDILISKSGLKNNKTNPELEEAITIQGKTFLESLINFKKKVEVQQGFEYLQGLSYSDIFNKDTEKLLNDDKVRQNLKLYMENYKKLLSESEIFVGNFDDKNALNTALALDNNGFFDEGRHKVILHNNNPIVEPGVLKKIIENLQKKAYTDAEVQEALEEVAKKIQATKNTNIFKQCLKRYPEMIDILLNNIEELKNNFWVAYLQEYKLVYFELVEIYEQSQEKINAIFEKANFEESEWKKVLNEFKDRFIVPFKLDIEKPKDCILGINKTAPSLTFEFDDKRVEKKQLIDVLSRGERRAFYLLNILFEIETRRDSGKKVLLVIDDIADSFDYQNKYAIIEYLKELSEDGLFKLLILTHNFDFFRSIVSRLGLKGNNLYAIKGENKIILDKPVYQGNVFVTWMKTINEATKRNVCLDKILISLIPFARNIVEYSCGKKDLRYKKLTSLLHMKSDSDSITLADLEDCLLGIKPIIPYLNSFLIEDRSLGYQKDLKVLSLIQENAQEILRENNINELELENKVVLSIAIRLRAEEFMKLKINDQTFFLSLEGKIQTPRLFEKYKELYETDFDKIKLLKKVLLMTPESIHLNSFMYEPLLDMSCDSLKELYKRNEQEFFGIIVDLDTAQEIPKV